MFTDFSFDNKVRIHFGKEALGYLPEILKDDKVLLVTSNSNTDNGNLDRVRDILKDNGIEYDVLKNIPGPYFSFVLKGMDLVKQHHLTAVIGLGSSAMMDIAKMIAFSICHSDDYEDYIFHDKELGENEKTLTIIEIPTYPAGGSEVDSSSEIDDLEKERHGHLYGIYPDYALLDPTLTYSLPLKLTIRAAMEAFLQVSTSYIGNTSRISKGMTKTVLETIFSSLDDVIDNSNNYEARANLMWAASLSTYGILSFGSKGSEYTYSIYETEGTIENLTKCNYATALIMFFPRWLLLLSRYHKEDVQDYFIDIWKVDEGNPNILKSGYLKMLHYFSSLGLPIYVEQLGNYTKEEVGKALCLSDLFSKEETLEAVYLCFGKQPK